jgi:hypothetical protein
MSLWLTSTSPNNFRAGISSNSTAPYPVVRVDCGTTEATLFELNRFLVPAVEAKSAGLSPTPELPTGTAAYADINPGSAWPFTE